MIRWFSSRTLLSGSWLCPGSYSHAPPFMQNVLSGETSSHQSRHRETPRRQRPNKCCLNKTTKVEQNSLNCGFSHIWHLLFRVSNGRCETESWWQWKYLCFCSDTTLTFYLSHKIVVPAKLDWVKPKTSMSWFPKIKPTLSAEFGNSKHRLIKSRGSSAQGVIPMTFFKWGDTANYRTRLIAWLINWFINWKQILLERTLKGPYN